ncbi:peptidase inhibitor family I36 protein [Nocardiopsis sp. N85]|uniref:peptidase inhibitor family I36 protein n=1 Tax=Nocardiopsis sp. N85 TaxID=3029400 RepID=UPI00237FA10B|nr:peptidase inhibitor family I36 protein [Nocardiopsis sp. N85]MDE3725059.1 peptidase inhibitor family I36 protein [Nocardiopsis sp. N85]
MQRKFGTTVRIATLGFIGALALGAGTPAMAVETTDVGAQALRSLYVYEHDNFKGRSAHLTANDSNFSDNYWSGGTTATIDDNISSFKNKGSYRAVMYPSANYSGAPYTAKGHSEDKDLSKNSNNPPNFDNKASSVRFVI